MGYNTHIMIGIIGTPSPEHERDMDKPYDDGSGYEYKKGENGGYVETGRMESFFIEYASMAMCKIYDSALSDVHSKYLKATKDNPDFVIYRYGSDGNTRIEEDSYGEPMVLAPLKEVLEAVQKDEKNDVYRRFKWLKGLLESMSDDNEKLVCIFYGS